MSAQIRDYRYLEARVRVAGIHTRIVEGSMRMNTFQPRDAAVLEVMLAAASRALSRRLFPIEPGRLGRVTTVDSVAGLVWHVGLSEFIAVSCAKLARSQSHRFLHDDGCNDLGDFVGPASG
jgi:hypothetical protein